MSRRCTSKALFALCVSLSPLLLFPPAHAQDVFANSPREQPRQQQQQQQDQPLQDRQQERSLPAPHIPAIETLINRAVKLCLPIEQTGTPDEQLYRDILDLNALTGENRQMAQDILTRFANEGGTICINQPMNFAFQKKNGAYGVTHPITTQQGQQRAAIAVAQFYNVQAGQEQAPVLEVSTFVPSYAASEKFNSENRAPCLIATSIIPLINREQDPNPFKAGVVTSFFAIDAQTCIGQDEKGLVWASLNTNQVIQPAFRIAAKDARYITPLPGTQVRELNITR